MITKSHNYALVIDGIVVARGSAKQMQSLRKKQNGAQVWLTSKPVGAACPSPLSNEIMELQS